MERPAWEVERREQAEGGDVGTLRRDITTGWADTFFFFEETVKVLQYFCKQGERGRQKERVAGDK